jgi:hypothetical protein
VRVCEFLRGCLVICRRLGAVVCGMVKCENLDDFGALSYFVMLLLRSGFNDDPDAKGTEIFGQSLLAGTAVKIQ